jgi:hypothetical protein
MAGQLAGVIAANSRATITTATWMHVTPGRLQPGSTFRLGTDISYLTSPKTAR